MKVSTAFDLVLSVSTPSPMTAHIGCSLSLNGDDLLGVGEAGTQGVLLHSVDRLSHTSEYVPGAALGVPTDSVDGLLVCSVTREG